MAPMTEYTQAGLVALQDVGSSRVKDLTHAALAGRLYTTRPSGKPILTTFK